MAETIKFDLVADLYDSYVNTEFDLKFFLEETKGYDQEILELMCGTGRLSLPLLKAGRKLVCVDYAEKMLDALRIKTNCKRFNVTILNQDVTRLDISKKFGFIIVPFHSLSEILTTELQMKTLMNISDHLQQGGTFICTLQNPDVRLKSADGKLRKLGDFRIDDSRRMTVSYLNEFIKSTGLVSGYQQYDIFDNAENLIESRTLYINFRPVMDIEFRTMISNLDLQITCMYGDYDRNPFNRDTSNFMIYKMRKK